MQCIKYECVRCLGEYFATVELIKSHFREKHGIYPEQLSPKDRKVYESYFEVEGRKIEEQEGDCGLNKDDMCEEYFDALDEIPDLCVESDSTDTANLQGIGSMEKCPSPADDAPTRYSDSSLTQGANEQQRVQSMDATGSDYTVLHSPIDLITDKDSDPYYCPDCGRTLGYSIVNFKRHLTRYRGRCKDMFAGKILCSCIHCKQEFSTVYGLKTHSDAFSGNCKTNQISMNLNSITHNFNGKVKETSKYEPNSPLEEDSLTKEELMTMCDNLKTVQKMGPYSCFLCGRGVGHSIDNLKRHVFWYKGHCRRVCSNRKLYSCQYCDVEFLSIYALSDHNKLLGDRCKHWITNSDTRDRDPPYPDC